MAILVCISSPWANLVSVFFSTYVCLSEATVRHDMTYRLLRPLSRSMFVFPFFFFFAYVCSSEINVSYDMTYRLLRPLSRPMFICPFFFFFFFAYVCSSEATVRYDIPNCLRRWSPSTFEKAASPFGSRH